MAETVKISGELESVATGNKVADVANIKDKTQGDKSQAEINAETQEALAGRYTKEETYNKEELDSLITTPQVKYESVTATEQTTAVTDVLPATGEADTIYRVGSWDGSQYDATCYSEYAWKGDAYILLSTKPQIGEVFDISAYRATGGELATYADLAAALDGGNNIPQSLHKGGMSVKFVQRSGNKYVQYRLMADSWSTTESDWQGVDDVPTAGSGNLVKSSGVAKYVKTECYSNTNNIEREDLVIINLMDKPALDTLFKADTISYTAKGASWEQICIRINLPIQGKEIGIRYNSSIQFPHSTVVNKDKNYADLNSISLPAPGGNFTVVDNTAFTLLLLTVNAGTVVNREGTQITLSNIEIKYNDIFSFKTGEVLSEIGINDFPTKDNKNELVKSSFIKQLNYKLTGQEIKDLNSVLIDSTISAHAIGVNLKTQLAMGESYHFEFKNPDETKQCKFYLGFKNTNGDFVRFSVNGSAYNTSYTVNIGKLSVLTFDVVFETPVTYLNCWIEHGTYKNTVDFIIVIEQGNNVVDIASDLKGYIGTYLSHCKSFNASNALTTIQDNRLLNIDRLVITTEADDWQSVDWYFNNPIIGKKVGVTVASRENGQNAVATLRCYDCLFNGSGVDNSHIINSVTLAAVGTTDIIVPAGTKALVVIFHGCYGTAVGEDVNVILSGIKVEYEEVVDLTEIQEKIDALQDTSETHSNQIQRNTTDIDDLKKISDLQQSISQYSRDITALTNRIEDLNNSFNDDHTINDNLSPMPIILDTDFGGDVDDVLAVRVLSYFEAIGAVRTIFVGNPNGARNLPMAMSAMLQYDGTMGVPIVMGYASQTDFGGYTETLAAYPHYANDEYPLYGATAYRKALSELTRKCILVFVGAYTNLYNLLSSSADQYSELSGIELVREKVERIYLMGGSFPDSTVWMDTGSGGRGREWNIVGNITASDYIIRNSPVPLVFCGWEIGHAIECGGGLTVKLPTNDAMIAAMRVWNPVTVNNGREGFDPITVAVACLGDPMKMGIEAVRGTVNFDTETGYTTFTESPTGNHYYLRLPYADVETNGYKKYVNIDYYKIYMNHILSKDWWGANNMCRKDRLL